MNAPTRKNRWARLVTVFLLATTGLSALAPTASAHAYTCVAGY